MFALTSICSDFASELGTSLGNLWESTGLYELFANFSTTGWQNLVMILISFVLVYLAIVKKFEPLLLLPIAFGMFIVNVPGAYRILFGEKGYILTDNFLNQEVLRGTKTEILEVLGFETIENLKAGVSSTFLADWLKDGEEFSSLLNEYLAYNQVTIRGTQYAPSTAEFVNLKLSTETVISNQGLFYYIYNWYHSGKVATVVTLATTPSQ